MTFCPARVNRLNEMSWQVKCTNHWDVTRPDPPELGVRGIALSVLAAASLIFLLRYARELFIPVAFSVLIAYALNPIVVVMQRIHLSRTIASAIVVLGLLSGSVLGMYALRYQVVSVIESLPEATQQFRERMASFGQARNDETGAIGKLQEAAKEIEKTVADATGESDASPRGVTRVRVDQPPFRASDYIWSGSVQLLNLASRAVMVSFLVFFVLASSDLFKRKLIRVTGTTLSEKRVTLDVLHEISSQVERFLLIQLVTGVIVGLATGLALWAFGVNQPAVWGVAAGVFNSVPYFGPIIVTAGLALVTFLQFGDLATTIKVAGTALAITSLEGFLLTPLLMGKAAHINGAAMFLSLLFWSWLWGVIGMIVAVPLTMVVKIVCDRIEKLQPIGELLGER